MSMGVIIGVSHKTYLGYQATNTWCRSVAEILNSAPDVAGDMALFTFPAMPLIPLALSHFAGTRMQTGAQNVSQYPPGAYTGETSASLLQEMGCRYVEIGHAERRRHFGETPEIIHQKIAVAFAHGLTPVICIGEDKPMTETCAAEVAIGQARALLDPFGGEPLAPLIFAWEPQWAIGAAQPASDTYIRHVCRQLRDHLRQHYGNGCRVIYGGSAGPGLLTRLWPEVDGIFLGRFAHCPGDFAAILDEARQLRAS